MVGPIYNSVLDFSHHEQQHRCGCAGPLTHHHEVGDLSLCSSAVQMCAIEVTGVMSDPPTVIHLSTL